jgi:hypothetical protein
MGSLITPLWAAAPKQLYRFARFIEQVDCHEYGTNGLLGLRADDWTPMRTRASSSSSFHDGSHSKTILSVRQRQET